MAQLYTGPWEGRKSQGPDRKVGERHVPLDKVVCENIHKKLDWVGVCFDWVRDGEPKYRRLRHSRGRGSGAAAC